MRDPCWTLPTWSNYRQSNYDEVHDVPVALPEDPESTVPLEEDLTDKECQRQFLDDLR